MLAAWKISINPLTRQSGAIESELQSPPASSMNLKSLHPHQLGQGHIHFHVGPMWGSLNDVKLRH